MSSGWSRRSREGYYVQGVVSLNEERVNANERERGRAVLWAASFGGSVPVFTDNCCFGRRLQGCVRASGAERVGASRYARASSENFGLLVSLRTSASNSTSSNFFAIAPCHVPACHLRVAEHSVATHVNEATDRDIACLFLRHTASEDTGQTQEERTRLAVGSAVDTEAAVRLRSALHPAPSL